MTNPFNYSKYAVRRTRDAFRDNKSLTDAKQIQKCIDTAKENLEVLKRQAIIGSLYQADKLIIEK
jgi:hypothetical protein